MLKKILIVAAVAVAALVVVIAKQPSDFNVSRNVAMDATKSAIFSHVNNFHKWEAWSPWAKIDPTATTEFEGAEEGVGAVMKWSSNHKEVGAGSMKIIESSLDNSIKIELEMVKPYSGKSEVEFKLEELNEKQTLVTWSMKGQKSFFAKAFGLFQDCSKMVSEQFDAGLSNLRAVAESKAPTAEVSEEVKTETVKEEVTK
jgi:hypothetical protein